jgi:hypothetical protein
MASMVLNIASTAGKKVTAKNAEVQVYASIIEYEVRAGIVMGYQFVYTVNPNNTARSAGAAGYANTVFKKATVKNVVVQAYANTV